MKTLDFILAIMFMSIGLFTVAMIVLFCVYQSVPDTLITSFFSLFTGEAGIMGAITIAKKIFERKRGRRDEC